MRVLKKSAGSRIFAGVGGFRLRVSRFSSRGAFGAEKDPVPTLPLWGGTWLFVDGFDEQAVGEADEARSPTGEATECL